MQAYAIYDKFFCPRFTPPPPYTFLYKSEHIAISLFIWKKNFALKNNSLDNFYISCFFWNSREIILYLINKTIVEIQKSAHPWDWLKVVPFQSRWNQPVSLFIDMPCCYVLISRSIIKLMYWIWPDDIIKKTINNFKKTVLLNAYKNVGYMRKILYIYLFQ